MKKNIILGLGLLALSMTACSKDEVASKPKQVDKVISTLTFDADVQNMPVVDFAEKGEVDEMRSVRLYGDQENGRAVEIRVDGNELEGKVRWLVTGFGGNQQATMNNRAPNKGKPVFKNRTGFEITKSGVTERGKVQHLHVTYFATGDWRGVWKKNQYGYLLIGGDQMDISTVEPDNGAFRNNFTHSAFKSNEKLVHTNIGAYTSRDLVLMTPMKHISISNDDGTNGVGSMNNGQGGSEGFNTASVTANLKPRGCIFAFKVKNESGHKIKVHSLEIINTSQYPSPLYYKGFFDVRDFRYDGHAGSGRANKRYTKDEYTVPFVGTEDTGSFPLYANETTTEKGMTLDNSTTTTGRFFLWGFPKPKTPAANAADETADLNNYKPLLVKVNYSFYDNEGRLQENPKILSMAQKFHAPSKGVGNNTDGWQDGWCYRATLKVKKRNASDGPLPVVEYFELEPSDIDSYDDNGTFGDTQMHDVLK